MEGVRKIINSMAKVLLADDSKFMRQILSKILSGVHEVVGEAESGEDAIGKYEELKPDVVLMDIVMPEKDGIEATREIISRNNSANIIICTSLGQEEKLKKAIEAGARGFITKPFKKEDVLKEIEKVLGC